MSLISAAYAETGVAGAAHEVGFFSQPETWVAIVFLIVVGSLWRPVCRFVCAALDQRGERIRARIEEAENLADQAQKLLVSFQKKQHESAKEVEAILQQARVEADHNAKESARALEELLARREKQAMERLAQAEHDALREVKNAAIDIAMSAAEKVLAKGLAPEQAAALIEDAIKDLPKRLH